MLARRAAWLVAALLASSACEEAPAALPPIRHIVVIVLDATNAAHLGCYGGHAATSPHLDALAARGVRFEHAYSNTTWTLPSTASLMSGLLPESHGVVTAQDTVPPGLPLFAERLQAAGWDTASMVQMIFASDRHGLQRGFLSFEYAGMAEGERYQRFLEHVREWLAKRGEQPSLLYLHFRRPHSPYDPPADALAPFEQGRALADGSRDETLRAVANAQAPALSAEEQERVTQLYRGGLRAIDAQVGELLPLLRLDQDTLLIVTSDHGEGLGEHGEYGHGRALWLEQVHVPLIVAGPGLSPRVVTEPVCTVDLAPTLLALAGLPPLPGGEGRSWLPLLLGQPAPARGAPLTIAARRYPGETPAAAAIEAQWFLRREAGGAAQLYDVDDDPEQRFDLSELQSDVIARLLPALGRVQAWAPTPLSGAASRPAPELSAEDEAELRALGYVR